MRKLMGEVLPGESFYLQSPFKADIGWAGRVISTNDDGTIKVANLTDNVIMDLPALFPVEVD